MVQKVVGKTLAIHRFTRPYGNFDGTSFIKAIFYKYELLFMRKNYNCE